MRLSLGVVFALTIGTVVSVGACTETLGHGCTEIGCSDSVMIVAGFSDHQWPVGAYRLELQLNELTRVCLFSMPAAQPPSGSGVNVPCDPSDGQLRVQMEPSSECMQSSNGGGVITSCERIFGRNNLRIDAAGAPSRLQLRLERDAVLVSQQEVVPSYVVSQPNGPDCPPVCRQSSFELQLD